jgi:hypothetical protein
MLSIKNQDSLMVIRRYQEHGDKGGYLQLGNTCARVLKGAGRKEKIDKLCSDCLRERDAEIAAKFPTLIHKLEDVETALLFRHDLR